MATVPRIATPTVEARPTPFVQQTAEGATPEAFGAAGARGMIQAGERLANFGEQVFRTAERIRLEEDQRAVTEAETEFAKRRVAVVRGDGTAENPGFYGMNGQNAIDGYANSRKALDDAREEIAAGIKSDRARAQFQLRANRQIVSEDETMIGHVTRQRTVAANAASEVKINTAAGEFARFYNDPGRGAEQLSIIEATVRETAQRNGITDQATVDGLVMAQRTNAVKGAVGAALDAEDTESAQKLLIQYAGQLDGRVQADLSRLLRDKVVTEEAQNLAETYWARVNPNDPASVKRVIDEMYRDLKGKNQDATLKYFNERLALTYRIEDQGMQTEAAARARRNDQEARDRREKADARREERDRLEAEDRDLRLERQRLTDERRQKADERRDTAAAQAEQRRLEAIDARLQANERRRLALARQEAVDARRATREEQETAGLQLAETVARQGGTPADQLARLRENATGDVLRIAEERLMAFQRNETAVRERTSRETYDRVADLVEAGTDPRKLPQADRDAMTPAMLKNLEERYRRVVTGAPTASVAGAFENYATLPPDKLAMVDLSTARLQLADADYNRLVSMVRRAVNDPKASGVQNATGDAEYITNQLNGLGFTSAAKRDDRARLFTAIEREVAAAREGNDGRLTTADRERIVSAAVKTYVKDNGWIRTSNVENTQAIQNRAQLPFAVLRAEQNLPVLQDFSRIAFPGREVTRQDALNIEATSINDYSVAFRREAATMLQDMGIRAPTPYQIRAFLYLEGAPRSGQPR